MSKNQSAEEVIARGLCAIIVGAIAFVAGVIAGGIIGLWAVGAAAVWLVFNIICALRRHRRGET